MRKSDLRSRVFVIAIITLISLLLIFYPRTTDEQGRKRTGQEMLKDFTSLTAIKANMQSHIKLGLDLKGGSHLVMQVQTDEVIKQLTDNSTNQAGEALKKANIPLKAVTSPAPGQINVELNDAGRFDEAKTKIQNELGPEWQFSKTGATTLSYTLPSIAADERRAQAFRQAMEIIENRVNAFGVAEPTIQSHGPEKAYQILLQLPGVDDPERVKDLIRTESRLELKAVVGQPQTHQTKEQALQAAASSGTPVSNIEALPVAPEPNSGTTEGGFIAVEKTAVITGIDLRDASAVPSRYNVQDYEIHFTLNQAGAERFGTWTGANIGKYLAVVLNGQVKTFPRINDRITDRGQITGDFTKETGEDLALVLRSGALPAKIVYLEERTVGPSLGADSIQQGVLASVVGLLLVMVFMLFYYRLSGLNAIIALILNLIFLIAGLALCKATLTLPGIAGIILLIGMAVDSNVLIFERIREELRLGKIVPSAVDSGFNKAFLTIIDTHVTTIVSAFFLFIFGTGPIRGFAVTLIIGLLANLFTSVYVSRSMFIYWLARGGPKVDKISI
ncbi:MAG: protein translocase subunit SecD [Acidobacteria bacterium]|nr:protein translocase subunit SecD [Acidobacteriota bacterium]